jgi:hypothetical protein
MFFTHDNILVRKHSKTPGLPLDSRKAELAKLLNDVKSLALLTSNAGRTDFKTTWFGNSMQGTGSSKVDAGFRNIYEFLNTVEQFTFTSANNDPNSIASFPQQGVHKVAGGMALGELKSKYKRSAFLYIGPKYTTVTYKEKVLTFVHEFTHMTLGTDDVKVLGKEMYGEANCTDLAETNANLALTNAENWALYSLSYWDSWRH